jgi:hypothetical protein
VYYDVNKKKSDLLQRYSRHDSLITNTDLNGIVKKTAMMSIAMDDDKGE